VADDYLAHDVYVGSIGADSVAGGHGDDTLKGNGACWTNRNNTASDDRSRSYSDENDRDTMDGGYGDEFINGNAGLDTLDGGQERHHAPSSAGIVFVRAVPRRRFGGVRKPVPATWCENRWSPVPETTAAHLPDCR